ncbi:response regulator [candidate division WWE3 bacterium CG06_land_8_20_14_3_00_42_16]|uniref:Response regulator n=1 Tax=candidate division WWE3 bacterium CG06_land_8_20_14_3_00_42_16 TaxID=1975083 RepID=A0A2M7AN28_UNCKA|nr:MAG: hypothetical protein AUJ38_00055 [bacterium CG1_02_42_9]PIU68796.1 MAG: response regulator [candidate division WWE3 bacterium CG06_land_8_20_14_3_00_42_16]
MEESKKIFLIEDDTDILNLYQRVLRDEGFEVCLNSDGSNVIEQALEFKPDLIVLDILLPKISGFDLLQAVKANTSLSNIPVFILTNVAEEVSLKKALDLGAHEYLTKAEYTPQEIIDHIKQHFREHQ